MQFGMQDTIEYYSLFHMSLKFEGVEAMLIMVALTVLFMLMMLAQFDRVMQIIDEATVRKLN